LRSYGRILVYNRSSKSAGTAVGDYLAGRGLGLGLPMSTLITGPSHYFFGSKDNGNRHRPRVEVLIQKRAASSVFDIA
jgi:hypothetical protein